MRSDLICLSILQFSPGAGREQNCGQSGASRTEWRKTSLKDKALFAQKEGQTDGQMHPGTSTHKFIRFLEGVHRNEREARRYIGGEQEDGLPGKRRRFESSSRASEGSPPPGDLNMYTAGGEEDLTLGIDNSHPAKNAPQKKKRPKKTQPPYFLFKY